MHWFIVILAINCGSTFDIGERYEVRVQAPDRLTAALTAEAQVDAMLDDPVKYSHARSVIPINPATPALSLAA